MTYDDNTTVVLETVSGGKKIVVDVDEIGFENANTNEKGTGVPAGFLLLQGFTLRIIECEEYPELNGLLLDISGYNIDMNNKLTVYIPSGVY